MTCLKTPEDMQKMREACALASETLGYIATMIAPGVTTNHIEMKVREFIADHGARAACLGYGGFPAAVCYEVNETVVHGFLRTILFARAISSALIWWWSLTVSTAICAIRLLLAK